MKGSQVPEDLGVNILSSCSTSLLNHFRIHGGQGGKGYGALTPGQCISS